MQHASALIEIEYPRVFQPGGEDFRDLALGLTLIKAVCRNSGEELARFDFRGVVPPGLHTVHGLSVPEPSGTWSMGPRTAFRLDLARAAPAGLRLEIDHFLFGPLGPLPAIVSSGRYQARCIFRGGTAIVDLGPAIDFTPQPNPSGGKRALVVLGMHRSGTSAMARVLSLAGAALPADLMPGMPDNPFGFWESTGISELNEAALNDVGSGWEDIFAASWRHCLSRPEMPLLEAARRSLRGAFSGHELIVLKDPRISLLVPVWDCALKAEGYTPTYLLMVRDPRAVADSILRRDGFAASKTLLLWTSYMVAAERDTRQTGRHFVRFDDLLNAPATVLAGLRAEMGLTLTRSSRAKISHFLVPSQQTQTGTEQAGPFSRVAPFYDALGDKPTDERRIEAEAHRATQWLTELEDAVGPIIRQARMTRLREAPGEPGSSGSTES